MLRAAGPADRTANGGPARASREIATNSGDGPSVVLKKGRDGKRNCGYNAATG
jgi:hypothetical protein